MKRKKVIIVAISTFALLWGVALIAIQVLLSSSFLTKTAEKYVSEYLPLDKAGAYGIQDGEVAEKFEGDYDNIVGLPLYRIRKIFVEKGYAKE